MFIHELQKLGLSLLTDLFEHVLSHKFGLSLNLTIVKDETFFIESSQKTVSLMFNFAQLLLVKWFLPTTNFAAQSTVSLDLLNVFIILENVLFPSIHILICEGFTIFEPGLQNSVVVLVSVLKLNPVVVLFDLLVSLR